MKILAMTPSMFVVSAPVCDGGSEIMLIGNRLPAMVTKNSNDVNVPINLQGLGHTGGEGSKPWLVTCASTRTSYIFEQTEALSDSYVSERLHIYRREEARLVTNMLYEAMELQQRRQQSN